MPHVQIEREIEEAGRWRYQVTVTAGDHRRRHDVTLAWSDYNLWSGGRVAPEQVVAAAFRFLLQREDAGSILPKFDCAVIRRYFPDVDSELPGLIEGRSNGL